MKYVRGRGLRGALLAAAAGTLSFGAGAAVAQTGTSGADLRRQLTTLADNPNSVAALIDAGRAALDHGDGNAALGFFTRAAELAPRDGRAKAGLAAANVQDGNALEALRLFEEARALGVADAELAGDRGLAYDLLGQPARAQQDYVVALRHREDPEVRRRLAVSLAISGQREAGLRAIEGLVLSGDRASLRTRALVLALSGDVNGAGDAARASMPAATANAMVPFLQRMSNLSPMQMASAAHLGRFPASGGGVRSAVAHDPGALAFAGGSASPLAARLPVATPASANAARRRPDAAAAPVRQNSRLADVGRGSSRPATIPSRPVTTSVAATTAPRIAQPHPHEPLVRTAGTVPAPVLTAQVQAPVELAGVSSAASAPVQAARQGSPDPGAWERINPAQLATIAPPASTELAGGGTTAPVQTAAVEAPVSVSTTAEGRIDFADVAAAISSLPVETERSGPATTTRPAPAQERSVAPTERRTTTPARTSTARQSQPARNGTAAPARTGNATTRTAAATGRTGTAAGRDATAANRTSTRAQTPAQRHPARIWVQIATAARSALPAEFARLRRGAPEALRGRTAYTAPSGGNGRLLVGPFATAAEARAFINRLDREDISAFAWSSTAGQEVAQVPASR